MESAYRRHYGWDAVGRSLAHFAVGKTFRMLTALVVLLILVRRLPVEQYAVYIAFQGLIVALDLLTSIGVKRALLRFLPELRATGNNRAAYRLLLYGMLLRSAVVALVLVGLLPMVPWIGRTFQVAEWTWLLPWYLGAGFVHITAVWLADCLECLLWQRVSQYSMALGGALAALGVAFFAATDALTLDRVVLAIFLGDLLALLLLALGWLRRWRSDRERAVGDPGWLAENRGRLVRFAAWGFALSQSGFLYGPAPNRLLAAHSLSTGELALLGVADSILGLVRRFTPTRLLMSMVRPLVTARFAATGDFAAATRGADFVLRADLAATALPVAVLAVVGEPLMAWVTAGKYPEAGLLLMGFLVVLLARSQSELLEVLAQALEKQAILLTTNLLKSASLFIALPLFPLIGVWGLVVSNLIGTAVANGIVVWRLVAAGYGFDVRIDLGARILAYAAAAGAAGWVCLETWGSPVAAVGCIVLLYGGLLALWPPVREREREILAGLAGGQAKRLGRLARLWPRGSAAGPGADAESRQA